ncbi:LptA/OstA family protein [Parvularcula dongshanensis]|uniref:Lipopolysaccharide export system protein LptA n=1 Tax=Parvularcula dongshanensis TaxID=1173995 RepID=A0A840I5Q8_9PROT|nr:lipopolysaccharide export system protein LptA [Parvularcula dongshanensis]
MNSRSFAGGILGLALLCVPAAAQQPFAGLSSDEPISVDAQRCDALQREDRVICTGEVMIAQGPALLTADRMEITFAPGTQDFTRIEGEGRVRYASGEDAISGRAGVFDAATSTITVTGDVVVVQGEQVITGDRLVYNTETGALSFSAADGGRVRGLFQATKERG